jgi:tetratricopeptide (TPR) repeat protein
VDPVEQRIGSLVEQLGDKDYTVRQEAQEQLAKLGFRAFDALTKASASEDLEVVSRARYLLRLVRGHMCTQEDPPEVRELLQNYSLQTPEMRSWRIQRLGELPDGAGLAALCRLIRFEKSPALANQAALATLQYEPADKDSQRRQAGLIREILAGSGCGAAKWLLAYLKLREDPRVGFSEWARAVEDQAAILQRAPRQTDATVVAALLYYLAEAQAKRGNPTEADQTAGRALQAIPTPRPPNDMSYFLLAHDSLGAALQRRGLFKWAEAEYRRLSSAGSAAATWAASRVAEMFHDQGNDPAAAETIEAALETVRKQTPKVRPQRPQMREVDGQSMVELRARMHYFKACHWKEKGDVEQEVAELKAALRENWSEVDSLIAYYAVANPLSEEHKEAERLLKRATVKYRAEIAEDQESPKGYNEFAWLVANTKGDLNEALRCSQKSLELSPNTAAYLDTLAHVYFAKGDFEQAVKNEARAAQLEPHSGLIIKELRVFRDALEKKRAKS